MKTTLYQACEVDNRDSQQMYGYLEARIETMKSRIRDLEQENQNLRSLLTPECEEFRKSA